MFVSKWDVEENSETSSVEHTSDDELCPTQ
jgi:hypothetical protein